MPGEFIDVRVDPSIQNDPELARKLEEICPVSIFRAEPSGVRIDESNLDECVLCDLCLEAAPKATMGTIVLPEMPATITPLVYAIPVQLLAYHMAVIRGTNVDQPRNLAKSVTVE